MEVKSIAINPYISFRGNAKDAILFYAKVFKIDNPTWKTYGENPSGETADEHKDLVLHCFLRCGSALLMICDDIDQKCEFTVGNNIYLSLSMIGSYEDSLSLFNELSESGIIQIPFAKQFWGDNFGKFTDKFGIGWMINHEE